MTKTYPKLYSRDTIGNIRVWWMEQDGNEYTAHSGIEGGAFIKSNPTAAKGKNEGKTNETTDVEQATKEILAKYKKQKESGYFEDIKDIDITLFFQPMLAHKWEDHKNSIDLKKGVYISPKLDGLRCVFTKDGAFSRNGKKFVSFPHIARELKPLFDADPTLILDGEIYCHQLKEDFNKIISLAKKTKPTFLDIEESEEYLEYWIFDCPTLKGGYHDRYTELKKLILDKYRDNKWIRLCIHKLVHSESDIEKNLQQYLLHKFEGLMINSYDGVYQNKRSKNLLKYKLFSDEEMEIVDVIEGIGNRSGMFGYFTLKTPEGKSFDSNARGSEDFYKKLLKEKDELVGKMATVRFQNYTPDRVPRFPVVISIRDYE